MPTYYFLLLLTLVGCGANSLSRSKIISYPSENKEKFIVTKNSMNVSRSSHSANLLPDGTVLIAGGFNGLTLNSAEIYNPENEKFSLTVSMVTGRYAHKSVTLLNGNVLLLGGYTGYAGTRDTLNSVELYDVKLKKFRSVGNMHFKRGGHQATMLNSGKVLITGGESELTLASAEIYDPASEKFTRISDLNYARADHTATLLTNGKVMIIGGNGVSKVEIFDPYTLSFSVVDYEINKFIHNSILTITGEVLVSGGYDAVLSLKSASVFDSTLNTFTDIEDMNYIRDSHSTTELFNHKILILGGAQNGLTIDTAEIYDPLTHSFTAISKMNEVRDTHTATLLDNGAVLITGGCINVGSYTNTAEIYYP